jgi:hypothetical protein
MLSVVGYQLSVIGFGLSVISLRLEIYEKLQRFRNL